MDVTTLTPDVQSQLPTVHVGLSRVGVTGVEKIVRLNHDGQEQLFWARLECFVDLGPKQKGAHMSRFEETVNDAIGEVVLGESVFRAEQLAVHIAELVRARQDALRAEVTIRARYPEARLLVGRWGEHDDEEGARDYLKAAGADDVAVSMLETRRQLLEATAGKDEGEPKRDEPVSAGHA